MLEDFSKYLEKKYGLEIVSAECNMKDGYVYRFLLDESQRRKINSFSEHDIQGLKIKTENFLAHETRTPLSMLREGKIENLNNQLILSGSKEFIDVVLYQMIEKQNNGRI